MLPRIPWSFLSAEKLDGFPTTEKRTGKKCPPKIATTLMKFSIGKLQRAIHSSGLFWRHVGECSGDALGRFGPLVLTRKARSDTTAHEPDLAGRRVNENIGRLAVFVPQTPLV